MQGFNHIFLPEICSASQYFDLSYRNVNVYFCWKYVVHCCFTRPGALALLAISKLLVMFCSSLVVSLLYSGPLITKTGRRLLLVISIQPSVNEDYTNSACCLHRLKKLLTTHIYFVIFPYIFSWDCPIKNTIIIIWPLNLNVGNKAHKVYGKLQKLASSQ